MDYITDIESRTNALTSSANQIPTTQEYCSDFCSDADDVR